MANVHRSPAFLVTLALLTLAVTAVPGPGRAQDDPAAGETAPVVLDGDVLFRLRGTSSFPAAERARTVAGRIAAAARDPAVAPDSLRAVPVELGIDLTVGGHRLVTLVESDARAESLTLPEFAQVSAHHVRLAIGNYRRDRESGRTLRSTVKVAVVGLVLALILVVVVRTMRRVEGWFSRRYQRTAESLQSRTFQFVSAERLWWFLRVATGGARTLAVLVLVYLYLQWALALFPWTRRAGRTLLSLVSDPVRAIALGIVGYLPSLFFLIVLVVIARWALRALGALAGAVERGTVVFRDFDAEWAQPTFRIVRFLLIALFVVVAYPYIPGSSSGAFKGVSLLLGLLVSFGSSSIVSNLIAGYTMIYRRAFRIGDRIRIGDHVGDVVGMRPAVTLLRTPKNEDVIIPNTDIYNSPVINYSAQARAGSLILHTTVGIGYEVPWRQVEGMLLMAADRTEGLVRERPAFVLQTSLGDFCVVYELNVHCGSAQQMAALYSALHANIQDVFNEYGVQIMTPAYEGDPEAPKVVPREHWHQAPAKPENR